MPPLHRIWSIKHVCLKLSTSTQRNKLEKTNNYVLCILVRDAYDYINLHPQHFAAMCESGPYVLGVQKLVLSGRSDSKNRTLEKLTGRAVDGEENQGVSYALKQQVLQ